MDDQKNQITAEATQDAQPATAPAENSAPLLGGSTAGATPADGVKTAPAIPEEPPAAWADKDGNLLGDWRQRLPEEIRNEKCLDHMASVQALATSYVHAQKMVGANKVAVPGENATPEEWGKIYDALGRPQEASGYEVPQGFQWASDEQRNGVLARFHAAGLSSRQAGEMLRLYGETMEQAAGVLEDMRRASESELRREWGLSYDQNIRTATRALRAIGIDKALAGNACLNDAGFIRAMAEYGRSLGETSLAGTGGNSAAGAPSALDAILSNPKDAYYDISSPSHNARVSEVARLLAMRS